MKISEENLKEYCGQIIFALGDSANQGHTHLFSEYATALHQHRKEEDYSTDTNYDFELVAVYVTKKGQIKWETSQTLHFGCVLNGKVQFFN